MQREAWLTGPHHQVGVHITRDVICLGRGLQGSSPGGCVALLDMCT